MINVSVLGYGNVGFHLVEAFKKSDAINLVQVYNRHPIKNKSFKAELVNNLNNLTLADVYIIAIPDDAIKSFSSQLKLDGLVVHTSEKAALGIRDKINPLWNGFHATCTGESPIVFAGKPPNAGSV